MLAVVLFLRYNHIFVINIVKTNAISKKYKNFMLKLGNGKNIEVK